jgi:hypothetical protein
MKVATCVMTKWAVLNQRGIAHCRPGQLSVQHHIKRMGCFFHHVVCRVNPTRNGLRNPTRNGMLVFFAVSSMYLGLYCSSSY